MEAPNLRIVGEIVQAYGTAPSQFILLNQQSSFSILTTRDRVVAVHQDTSLSGLRANHRNFET
jgi:hypothetical protein